MLGNIRTTRSGEPGVVGVSDWRKLCGLSFDALTLVERRGRFGNIHPNYPAQVTISYFQGGQICPFIAEKWGYDKLLAMIKISATRWTLSTSGQQRAGEAGGIR